MNYWKYIAVCLLSLLVVAPAWGQLDTIKTIRIRDAKAFMTTDHLGALYIVERNEIQKYPQPIKSNKRIRFSDPQNGDIAHIDPFNPLAIVVLYKPFNQILIIDNQLNTTTNRIEPEQLGVMDIQLVSATEQNMLWMYDQASDRLYRYNLDTRRIEFQSQIITKLAGQEVSVAYLTSDMNGVYLSCPEVGILIFDFFGNYRKRLPEKNIQRFQVKNRSVIFYRNQQIEIHDIEKPESRKVFLGIDEVTNIRLEERHVFIQTKDNVIIGRLTQ